MKRSIVGKGSMLLSILFAVTTLGDTTSPTTASMFRQRLRESIRRIIAVGSSPMTNRIRVQDEVLAALHETTPESLQHPRVVASVYFPDVTRGAEMSVAWIEEYPTLQAIQIRNPETGQQITVTPKLENPIRDAESILIYRAIFTLPKGFVNGITQTLEISAPGQNLPATCYPSVHSEMDIAAPKTKPSERG